LAKPGKVRGSGGQGNGPTGKYEKKGAFSPRACPKKKKRLEEILQNAAKKKSSIASR